MTRNPTLSYIGPFLVFIGVMAAERLLHLPAAWLYPVRALAATIALLLFSRASLAQRPSSVGLSVLLGAAVFVLWIGPDLLFGPAYRHFWLFENSINGRALSSIPPNLHHSVWFLALRAVSCALVVPPLEELFWRGWLMRWLINPDFWKVPPGTFQMAAFWIVALLFAAEHGPYWEVGLATGIIYNWWMVRTRNLTDCIVAHAVTNGLLSIYVLYSDQFQYWL